MSEPEYIFGIDPSLTGTALCRLDRELAYRVWRYPSESSGKLLVPRFERYQQVVNSVFQQIECCSAHCYLEGYSFGSKGQAVINIAEYGSLLRKMLIKQANIDANPEPIEIPPTVVKKFVTGKGNADKTAVALGLFKRYGVEFPTSDECDAYAVARIGACIAGWCEPQTDFQREAIDVVLHGRKKQKKKTA